MRKFIDPDVWEQEQELKTIIDDKATYRLLKELGEYIHFIDSDSVESNIDYEDNYISFSMNLPKQEFPINIRDIVEDIYQRLGGDQNNGPGRYFQHITVTSEDHGNLWKIYVYVRWGIDV
jgi:hypothetical protein